LKKEKFVMSDYKWIEIITITIVTGRDHPWYRVGQRFEVVPYRYNPKDYFEVRGWNGIAGEGNLGHKFWIAKEHAKFIIIPPLDDDLFVIK